MRLCIKLDMKHNNTKNEFSACDESRPFYRTTAFKATAFANTVVAASGLNAQSDNTSDSVLKLEDTTLVGEEAPDLASPKFTAPLRDTPRTINVIPESVINQQQAISLRDALRNSPGISFQAGEGGSNSGDNLFIRGFSAEGDVFVDGSRDNAQYSRDVYNLEQIEVSKGPSSATSGRGSTGGSVNMVTKKAFVGELSAGNVAIGTDDYLRVTADHNTTIDEESGTAIRVNAMFSDYDVPGREGVGKSSWAINPTIGRDLGENARLTLGYEFLKQDNLPDNGLWRDAAGDSNYDWSRFYGLYARDHEEVNSERMFAEFSSTLENGFTLRNYTQWSDATLDFAVTSPRVATVDDVTVATYRDVKQKDRGFTNFSNDLNLSGEFGGDQLRHRFSAGIEYSKEGYINYSRAHIGDAPTAALYDPDPNINYDFSLVRTGAYSDAEGDTTALYAFDTISFNEHWDLNLGLRWESFDVTQDSYDADGSLSETLESNDDMLSYNGGIVYKPTENGSIYFGYGTSFSPSAEDLSLSASSGRRGPPSNHPDLEPEETRNYELGTKWDVAEGRLSLSGALFRTEKTNAKILSSDGNSYVLEGEQSVEGIELGVSGMITERWSAYGGYSILETSAAEVAAGEEEPELPYAPSSSLNFWTSYQATDRLMFGGGAQYSGDYYYSASSDPSTIPDNIDYWLVDLVASFNVNENLDLRLNVKNATDEKYIERGYGGHFVPGATRSLIVSADYRF